MRIFGLTIGLFCSSLLAFGYYLQYVVGLEPCPLCIIQRVCYALTAIFGFLLAAFPIRIRLFGSLGILSTLLGAGTATRQVWLQHLPKEDVPACGPGLSYMLETFPLNDVIKELLEGSGECANVSWTFLSFSLGEWSLLVFIVLCISFCMALRKKK